MYETWPLSPILQANYAIVPLKIEVRGVHTDEKTPTLLF
jgi:hypothetical protein